MKYDKLLAEKCVEDASEYIWLRWEARSVLIGNHRVLNWIVFYDNSDCFLKCSDVFGTMSILMSKA